MFVYTGRPKRDGLEQFGAAFSQSGHSIPKTLGKIWDPIDDFEPDIPPRGTFKNDINIAVF